MRQNGGYIKIKLIEIQVDKLNNGSKYLFLNLIIFYKF